MQRRGPDAKSEYSINYGDSPSQGDAGSDCGELPGGAWVFGCTPGYDRCTFPEAYVPCLDENETLATLWGGVLSGGSERLLSYTDRDVLLENVEENLFEGEFFGDPVLSLLHYAIGALDEYRDDILNTGCCPGTRDFISHLFENPWGIFHVEETLLCTGTHATMRRRECRGVDLIRGFDRPGETRAYFNPITFRLVMCPDYFRGLARIMDEYMFLAHRLLAMVVEGHVLSSSSSGGGVTGLTTEELRYLECAQTLAKVAFGAVTTAARTILHEMVHYSLAGGRHCPNSCCMQRIALRWQCRVNSRLGLFGADETDVNAHGVRSEIDYASSCTDWGDPEFGSGTGLFNGVCEMDNPGRESGPEDYTKGGFRFDEAFNQTVTCTDAAGDPNFCDPASCETC